MVKGFLLQCFPLLSFHGSTYSCSSRCCSIHFPQIYNCICFYCFVALLQMPFPIQQNSNLSLNSKDILTLLINTFSTNVFFLVTSSIALYPVSLGTHILKVEHSTQTTKKLSQYFTLCMVATGDELLGSRSFCLKTSYFCPSRVISMEKKKSNFPKKNYALFFIGGREKNQSNTSVLYFIIRKINSFI